MSPLSTTAGCSRRPTAAAPVTSPEIPSPVLSPLPAPEPSLSGDQQQRLQALCAELEQLAAELANEPAALLALLRQIEQLHRNLQDGPFRSSLPSDRNQLFALLQSMERSGGWPYIPRLQLRTFMDLLQQGRDDDSHPLAA